MGWLPVIGAGLCALTWLTPMPAGGGWLWDFGNGLGFVAFALILLLSLAPGRSRLHQTLAWLAVGAAVIHGGYLLALDGTLIEYLKLSMPLYMAAGLLALALLALNALTAGKVRRRIYPSRRSFRMLHWALSAIVIAATGYHVAGSAFYINDGYQMAFLAMPLVAFAVWPRLPWAARPMRMPSGDWQSSGWLTRQVILALTLASLLASLVLVVPRNL